MTKTMNWPAKAMYIALALALAFSLAAVTIAPSQVNAYSETQWNKVTSPSYDDLVIQPGTDIIDFAASADGETVYAILDGIIDDTATGNTENGYGNEVVKSTDGGITWDDITEEVQEEGLWYPMMVAIAPDNADYVFVTGYGDNLGTAYNPVTNDDPTVDGELYMVVGSDDGGDDFSDMLFQGTPGGLLGAKILCIAVAPETGDAFNVGVGTDGGDVYRYKVGGTFGGSWEDTTTYQGWDNIVAPTGVQTTTAVVAIDFSPYFDADDTVVVITTDTTFVTDGGGMDGATYMQSGIWGTTKAWNAQAGDPFPAAVEIMDAPPYYKSAGSLNAARYDEWDHAAGIAMPLDFTGNDSGLRYNWVYLNYDANDSGNGVTEDVPASFQNNFMFGVGQVFQVKGSGVTYAGVRCEAWDTSTTYPKMASIDMTGEIDDGALMVGLQGPTAVCAGIDVFRTAEWPIDLCCPQWSSSSKDPTGQTNTLVQYVDDGAKGYAVTSEDRILAVAANNNLDESAFSISGGDGYELGIGEVGKYWNQSALVDTWIDYLSDMAVNPTCGTIYLFAINDGRGADCDSVWRSIDDGSSYLRVFSRGLTNDFGLVRTAPEEEDEILTVYLVDQGTKDLWWNEDSGLSSWNARKASTLDNIWDLAIESEDTIYALEGPATATYGAGGNDADVSMSDKHGAPGSWSSAKDSKVDVGHSIVVRDGHVLVGGDVNGADSGEVGFSDDSASSFSELDDIGNGDVTLAFDTYYDQNDYVYAAVSGTTDRGVYRTTVADGDFKDMGADFNAVPTLDFHGIVTELRQAGNPKTTSSTGGVLYAVYTDGAGDSGIARQLTPASALCCNNLGWDWLDDEIVNETFDLNPRPLKICGCLTSSSATHLWAIDNDGFTVGYDMIDGTDPGGPWVYRDCFSKAGPTLTNVPDGSIVAAGDCACGNEVFTLNWERLCNECEYEFDIALDDSFTKIVVTEQDIAFAGFRPRAGGFYDPPKNTAPSVVIGEGVLDCSTEYFWRVRTRYSDRPETIRSWWSDTWSFTVESCASLGLTAPDDGSSNLPLEGIGFTWQAIDDASYDFTLSANSDLSSPIASETGISGTAYAFDGKLDYSTTYFWNVVAMDGSNVIGSSDVSTFTTRPAPTAPPTLPEYPEYPDYPEPIQPSTPAWVWVVIAMGAVLVIVIIVLIFRTRRV